MQPTRELTNLEKSYLLGHLPDYDSPISQYIIRNRDRWTKSIKDCESEYKSPYSNEEIMDNFDEPLSSSLRKIKSMKVTVDILPFLMAVNNEYRMISMHDALVENHRALKAYLEYIIFKIIPHKIEAIELARRIHSDMAMDTNSFSYMTHFINVIKRCSDTIDSFMVDKRAMATEIARALLLFHRLQVCTTKELPITTTCDIYFKYILMVGGYLLFDLVKDALNDLTSSDYLPLRFESSLNWEKFEYDVIKEDAENYVSDIVTESGRTYTYFGKFRSKSPVYGFEARWALGCEPDDITPYVKTESVSFDIPERDMMSLIYDRKDLCDEVVVRTPDGKSRHILTMEGCDDKFLLFKIAEEPDTIYGLGSEVHQNRRSVITIAVNPKYTYEMVMEGDLL